MEINSKAAYNNLKTEVPFFLQHSHFRAIFLNSNKGFVISYDASVTFGRQENSLLMFDHVALWSVILLIVESTLL